MGVGWGIWISKCLFKTLDWMPKLFWQQLHTRGRTLVHCWAAHCWMVQSSQPRGAGRRGWQLQGEGRSCPTATVGCLDLAHVRAHWGFQLQPHLSQSLPACMRSVISCRGNPDYLWQKAIRKKEPPPQLIKDRAPSQGLLSWVQYCSTLPCFLWECPCFLWKSRM